MSILSTLLSNQFQGSLCLHQSWIVVLGILFHVLFQVCTEELSLHLLWWFLKSRLTHSYWSISLIKQHTCFSSCNFLSSNSGGRWQGILDSPGWIRRKMCDVSSWGGHSSLHKLFWVRCRLILPAAVVLPCKHTTGDDQGVFSRKTKVSFLKVPFLLLQSWYERSTCTGLHGSTVRITLNQELHLCVDLAWTLELEVWMRESLIHEKNSSVSHPTHVLEERKFTFVR